MQMATIDAAYTVADKKSSRFRCVQRRFISVPLVFCSHLLFPLCTAKGGQTFNTSSLKFLMV